VLEEAQARGIAAAIVLSAGFGEGGHLETHAERVRAAAASGMRICGPNCFGIVNVRSGAAMFSGVVPRALIAGQVALVSQSGSLGNFAFSPLMRDRKLGFSHFISCGNQLGTTIEDYAEYLVEDPDVQVIAVILEALTSPRKLSAVAQRARALRKSMIFCQVGKSNASQRFIGSHTGALAGNSEILQAFLRRCGIMAAESYDEFVEAMELLAHAPLDEATGDEVILVSGSGGAAAVAVDHLEQSRMNLCDLHAETKERLRSVLPAFASAINPIDATGVVYDDPALLPSLFDAIFSEPGRPIIAASIIAAPVERMRRIAGAIADAARRSGRTVVAYQPSSLGLIDEEIVNTLHAAGVPLLMGISNAMAALKHLPLRRDYFSSTLDDSANDQAQAPAANAFPSDFLGAREALAQCGIPVVDTALVSSVQGAVAQWRKFAQAVALKAEARGLLHKSDLGCVRLNCATESDVIAGYETVIQNARKAGFETSDVIIQPMMSGVAETFAGIINNPPYGPAIVFGLGGIFVELLGQTTTEMAPLAKEDALRMISGLQAASLLTGARGRQPGDIDALATLLAQLSQFAVANSGSFRALDLNPIIVKPAGQGVFAVDIAIEHI
jgi:acetyltransferase